ncbi:radical SAM protein [Marinilabiliaceae bacterium ANBcel2]|nr:radical SAM protein [Marinilabiliaceae bacterium ANBcel2]
MGTFLFDKIIFGPVKSRRLGVSLGINLLPVNQKICSFNCIYCECGLNPEHPLPGNKMPSRLEVKESLEKQLKKMSSENNPPDVITFAGNGEPTLHKDFDKIVDDTIELRNSLSPKAKIAVLSNGSKISSPKVFNALLKVDDNILKLDSAFKETVELIDRPAGEYSHTKTVNEYKKFKGRLIVQTLFLKGTYNEKIVDNTTEKEIDEWLKAIKEIKPQEVMIYTIARDTPVTSLKKTNIEKLKEIAAKVEKLGIPTQVSE